jgi:hypothetical protein
VTTPGLLDPCAAPSARQSRATEDHRRPQKAALFGAVEGIHRVVQSGTLDEPRDRGITVGQAILQSRIRKICATMAAKDQLCGWGTLQPRNFGWNSAVGQWNSSIGQASPRSTPRQSGVVGGPSGGRRTSGRGRGLQWLLLLKVPFLPGSNGKYGKFDPNPRVKKFLFSLSSLRYGARLPVLPATSRRPSLQSAATTKSQLIGVES